MTSEQINAAQTQINVKYDVAKKICEILDAAAERYGVAHWEEDSESEILEVVGVEQ